MSVPDKNAKNLRVAVIEDDPQDLLFFQRAAKKVNFFGNHIRHYFDLPSFIQHAEDDPSDVEDLMFLDLNLPGISGLDGLPLIRNHPLLGHLPVIVLSGSTNPSDVKNCYRRGASCFMSKPLVPNDFKEALELMERFWSQVAKISSK